MCARGARRACGRLRCLALPPTTRPALRPLPPASLPGACPDREADEAQRQQRARGPPVRTAGARLPGHDGYRRLPLPVCMGKHASAAQSYTPFQFLVRGKTVFVTGCWRWEERVHAQATARQVPTGGALGSHWFMQVVR